MADTMKWMIALIVACAWHCPVFAGDAKTESGKGAGPDVGEALTKAAVFYEAMMKEGVAEKDAMAAGQKFAGLLQSVAGKFENVATHTENGTATWKSITLNSRGKGLDCIRFRTPKGDARDMAWAYIAKEGAIEGWYIIPVEGEALHAFENFFDLSRGTRPGTPTVIVQSLSADALKADKEYLMWFKTRGADAVDVTMAINQLPKGAVENNPDDLAKAVGVADGVREFRSRAEKRESQKPKE
jgi:hypothetical protein